MSHLSCWGRAGLSVLAQHCPLGCDIPCQEGGQFWALGMSPTPLGSSQIQAPRAPRTLCQSCLYPGRCQRYPDQALGRVSPGKEGADLL